MSPDACKAFLVVSTLVIIILLGFYANLMAIYECQQEGHGFWYCNGLMNTGR